MGNYQDYLLIFNQRSPFLNPITSDTLMGGFLYYLSLYDKSTFTSFYQDFYNNNPPFITSSLFPFEYIPINSNFLASFFSTEEKNTIGKKIKKINFVKKDFFEIADKKNYLQSLVENSSFSYFDLVKKEMVNIKDKEKNDNRALPYTFKGYFFKNKKAYFFLRVFKLEKKELIISLFKDIFFYGLGKRSSINFNHFEFEKEEAIKISQEGDYFINLSFFQFDSNEKDLVEPLFFDIEEKNPRLGPIYGKSKPFKNSFFGVKEGSIFKTKEKRSFFGRVNPGLYPKNKDFFPIQILYCLPYYFSI